MLKSVALLGLLSSVGTEERVEVSKIFDAHHLDLEEFREKCQILREKDGMELIAQSESTLIGLI